MTQIGGRASRRRDQRRRRMVRAGSVVGALAAVGLVVGTVVLVTRSDPETASTARRREATTSSSTSSTTTTTVTVVPATPVPRSSNPVVALAQQYDGYYTGTWRNSTSGATGAASLEVRIDPNANTLATVTQLDGDFFGSDARPFGRLESTITIGDPNAAVATQTERFGPVTARLDNTLTLVVEAPDIPDNKVKSFRLTGGLRADQKGFDATFTITYEDGSTSDGTMSVSCAPEGQRPSQVTTLCSL